MPKRTLEHLVCLALDRAPHVLEAAAAAEGETEGEERSLIGPAGHERASQARLGRPPPVGLQVLDAAVELLEKGEAIRGVRRGGGRP